MLRLLLIAVIVGVLAILLIFFVSPFVVSEADLVSVIARLTLGLSNLFFENTPADVLTYVNGLNLLLVALTVGLFLTVAILAIGIGGYLLKALCKGIASLLHREKKEEPRDMSPIDMDSRFKSTGLGEDIIGRGLDDIDQNRPKE